METQIIDDDMDRFIPPPRPNASSPAAFLRVVSIASTNQAVPVEPAQVFVDQRWPLYEGETAIGRNPELPNFDSQHRIVMANDRLQHGLQAIVKIEGGTIFLQNKGTHYICHRFRASSPPLPISDDSHFYELHPGDQVRLGKRIMVTFELAEQQHAPQRPRSPADSTLRFDDETNQDANFPHHPVGAAETQLFTEDAVPSAIRAKHNAEQTLTYDNAPAADNDLQGTQLYVGEEPGRGDADAAEGTLVYKDEAHGRNVQPDGTLLYQEDNAVTDNQAQGTQLYSEPVYADNSRAQDTQLFPEERAVVHPAVEGTLLYDGTSIHDAAKKSANDVVLMDDDNEPDLPKHDDTLVFDDPNSHGPQSNTQVYEVVGVADHEAPPHSPVLQATPASIGRARTRIVAPASDDDEDDLLSPHLSARPRSPQSAPQHSNSVERSFGQPDHTLEDHTHRQQNHEPNHVKQERPAEVSASPEKAQPQDDDATPSRTTRSRSRTSSYSSQTIQTELQHSTHVAKKLTPQRAGRKRKSETITPAPEIHGEEPTPPKKRQKHLVPKGHVLLTGLAATDKADAVETVKHLGWSLTEGDDASSLTVATHIVVPASLKGPTVKLLQALSCCPNLRFVVTLEWLRASKESKRFVEEADFLLPKSSPLQRLYHVRPMPFQVMRTDQFTCTLSPQFNGKIDPNPATPRNKLLLGYTFYIAPKCDEPKPEDLRKILEAAGATCTNHFPATLVETTKVIGSQQDLKDSGFSTKIANSGYRLYTFDFVKHAILEQRADWDKHYISPK